MTTEKAPNVPPFVRFCTASVPMVFDNSMSYYECLCALNKFIQDLVNTVNYNATQLDGLQEGFKELKDYVDNYFANLDVQAEINAKLDEMAEGGQLATIIAQFLAAAPVFAYGTIAEMAAATNLNDGCIARVLGNTLAANGDGAYYIIRTKTGADDPDGVNLVAIGDSLVGVRVQDAAIKKITDNPINVLFNGVKGDGVTDDTLAIQAIIDNNPQATIYFPAGNYLVSDTIKIKQAAIDLPDFIFDSKAKIFTNETLDYLIAFTAENEPSLESFARLAFHQFKGGIFDGNNIDVAVILADSLARDIHFEDNSIIRNRKIGLWLKYNSAFTSGGALVENLQVSGMSSAIDGNIAIKNDSYDNEINNFRCTGCQVGIYTSGSCRVFNAHPLFAHTTTPTAAEWNASIGFRVASGASVQNTFINCYPDGFAIGWQIDNSWSFTKIIDGYANFSVTPMTNGECSFVYMKNPNSVLVLEGCRFDPSDPSIGVSNFVAHNIKVDGDCNLLYARNFIRATNCYWNVKSYIPSDDPSYGMRTNKFSSVMYNEPYVNTMTADEWYIIGMVNANQAPQEFRLDMASDGCWDIKVQWTGGLSSGSATLSKTNIITPQHNYTLGLINGYVKGGVVYSYLAIKTSDNDVYLNADLSAVRSASNGEVFSAYNKYGTSPATLERTTATLSLN